MIQQFIQNSLNIALLLFLFISSSLIGKAIFRNFRLNFKSFIEEILFSSALGLGIFAYIFFGIGLMGLYYRWIAYIFLLLPFSSLLFIYKDYPLVIKKIITAVAQEIRSLSLFEKILLTILIAEILLNFTASLAPATGVDTLTSYLALPKIYIKEQRLFHVWHIYTSEYPSCAGMLFTFGMLLSSEVLAPMIQFLSGIIIVAIIYIISRRYYSTKTALIASCLFYSISSVSYQSSMALLELVGCAFCVFCILSLYKRFEENNTKWIFISAIYAGFFAATKLPFVAILPLAGPLFFYMHFIKKEKPFKNWAFEWGIFSFIALIIVSPWYVKSYIYTGNPVHPWLYSLFGSTELYLENNFNAHVWEMYRGGNLILIFGRILKHMLNVSFDGRFYQGWIGPIFLSFLPFLFIVKKDKFIKFSLFFSFTFLFSWALLFKRVCTLFPALVFLSILVGYTMCELSERGKTIKVITNTLFISWLLVGLTFNVNYHLDTVPVVLGFEKKDVYLTRILSDKRNQFPHYADYKIANRILPEDACILLMPNAGFYLERDYIRAFEFSNSRLLAEKKDLISAIRDLGITHVLYVFPETSDWRIELRKKLERTQALKTIYESNTMRIDKLKS